MQITNQQAHENLKLLNTYFDEYNRTGFLTDETYDKPISEGLIIVYQNDVKDVFELIKFLYSKEKSQATKTYMMGCGKTLLRLSYLRGENRKETSLETYEYFKHFTEKYQLNEIAKDPTG